MDDDIIFSHPCKKMQSPEVFRLHCFVACFVRVYSAVAVVSVVAVVQEVCTPVCSWCCREDEEECLLACSPIHH